MVSFESLRPSRQDLLALAEAVAKRGSDALLIDHDNRNAGFCSISEAIDSGGVYAVEVDDSVLALDADTEDAANFVREQIASELERAGFHPVLLQSGQPGRVHLFVRIEDRRKKWYFEERARLGSVDVRKGGSRIRPPLSPHRQSLPVGLISPDSIEVALGYLRPRARVYLQQRPISQQIETLLRCGDTTGRYMSRSEVAMAIATGMVNCGFSEAEVRDALLNTKNAGGAKPQEIAANRGCKAAERWIANLYRRAQQYVATRPPLSDKKETLALIARIEQVANSTVWKGKGGATELAVLQAYIEIARRRGSLDFSASVREVAEGAGVTAPTVSKAVKRLANAGWIRKTQKGDRDRGSMWKLLLPENAHNGNNHPRGCRRECICSARFIRCRCVPIWRTRQGGSDHIPGPAGRPRPA